MIVPTLCVGMQRPTLRIDLMPAHCKIGSLPLESVPVGRGAPLRRSYAECGQDLNRASEPEQQFRLFALYSCMNFGKSPVRYW